MKAPSSAPPVSRRAFLAGSAAAAIAGRSAAGSTGQRGPWGDSRPTTVIDCHAHLHAPQPPDLGGRRPQADRGGRPAGDRPALLLDPHPAPAGHGRGLPRLQPVGRRGHEAVPGPRARLLLRQPRPSARGARGDPPLRARIAGSSASSSTTNTDAPTRSSSRSSSWRSSCGVPILHHAGHSHYFVDGAAAHLRRRPPRRARPALPRGHADLRPHLRRRRLGVDDQGPPRCAPSVFLDTSGSVTDDGVVEMAARVLGVDRLLFACDMSMTAVRRPDPRRGADPGTRSRRSSARTWSGC